MATSIAASWEQVAQVIVVIDTLSSMIYSGEDIIEFNT